MPGVKIEGQPGGAAGPGGPGGPVGASGSFGGYSTSQLLMAQDGGGAAALGPGAFMAAHAMRSMNVSASLGGNAGFNPMAIAGVHGTGLLGLGLTGMGPGIGNVRPNLNVVSAMAGGSMMGSGMTDALLRDIAVTGHEQVRIERRQLALEEAFGTGRGRMPGIWRSSHTAGGPADMPMPPGGWGGTAQVPRSWQGTNAPGDGEGGGGGGGGGGRWSGGTAGGGSGGRRGGRHPLWSLGHAANSNITGAVETAAGLGFLGFETLGPWGALAGAAAGLGYGLWEGPHVIAGEASRTIARARPAMDFRLWAFGAGRAGGFSGSNFADSIFPGGLATPDWMSALGLTPQSVEGELKRFGIAPTSGAQGRHMASALARYAFLPGLSGVAADAQATAAMAARYGVIGHSGRDIDAFGLVLSQHMKTAVAEGMDRASVMHNLSAAITMMARNGAPGIGPTKALDFLMQFSGMPGGRTGEAGLQALAGLQSAVGAVGKSPLQTMAASFAFANVKTHAELTKILGYDPLGPHATPLQQVEAKYYLEAAKAGATYYTGIWGSQLAEANPAAAQRIFGHSPLSAQLPDYAQPLAVSAIAKVPLGQAAIMQSGVGKGAGARITLQHGKSPHDLYAALQRMGIKPSLIWDVITAARANGIDPIWYAGIIMNESSGGYDTKDIGSWGMTGAQNPSQIISGQGFARPTSPGMSIAEGAELAHQKLVAAHGDYTAATVAYHGKYSAKYMADLAAHMQVAGDGGNIPSDLLNSESKAGQFIMEGAWTSLSRMNVLLAKTNPSLDNLTNAVNKLTKAVMSSKGVSLPYN